MTGTRVFLCLASLLSGTLFAEPTPEAVRSAMRQAASYYRENVARHGGYVYHTTVDFSKRWGEGPATEDQIWVQPPATPTVGMAYLSAYHATKDSYYLEAAIETAEALVHGQLESGGWTHLIDFNPKSEAAGRYRNGQGHGRNHSTLDDGISQAAIRFLVRLDKATGFQHVPAHEAAKLALNALLDAQFPNGAFPQVWDGTPQPPGLPADRKANYPDYDWKTEGRIKEYWNMYTLNDDLAPTVTRTLVEAHQVYRDKRIEDALRRFGGFLVLAQMPEPQRAWAQQYNHDMQPIWARKFEPPAISGRVSEGVVVSLMKIASYLRESDYLKPIPAALDHLKKSELPGGRLARYYELGTNRPLYMERQGNIYSLTYDDTNLPDHYGWKTKSHLASIAAAWRRISAGGQLPSDDEIFPSTKPEPTIGKVLADLDGEGRWVSVFAGETLVGQPEFQPGDRYLSSAVFSRNLELLGSFLVE